MTLRNVTSLRNLICLVALATLAAIPHHATVTAQHAAPATASWKTVLESRLPAFGHRNWIVIADSAYPAQSRSGIETIATGAEQLEVVQAVLDRLGQSKHVQPKVYLDAELPHIPEADAPGIRAYRERLAKLLADRKSQSLPHEKIIDQLDKAGEKFNVLVLKTTLTLPYTSVFLELDCGYWNADKEARLRQTLQAAPGNP